MSDAPASPSGPHGAELDEALDDAEPLSLGRRAARVAAVVAAISIAGLWAYALWGPTEKTFPGTLTDPTFTTQAEAICTDTAARLAQLQPAYQSQDARTRAAVIAQANAELAVMLDRLGAAAPDPDSKDGRMIHEWLGDWRTYLGDRQRYVEALATDPSARFYVTEKDRRQITEPIDFFAGRANDMPNCVTPGDLA